MKYLRLFCLLLLSLTVTHAAPAAQPIAKEVIAAAHKTTYHIQYSTFLEHRGCSATAIAPNALLTATHCELGTDELQIEGHKPVHIAATLRDGLDHSIVLLDGITFERFADFSDKAPDQGDAVFVFGNPGGFTDLFRGGYFSGLQQPRGLSALFGAPPLLVFDFNGFHGDSGEAIFNDAGKIVAVTSVLLNLEQGDDHAQLMGAFPIHFTPAQLKQALDYKSAVPDNKQEEDDEDQ